MSMGKSSAQAKTLQGLAEAGLGRLELYLREEAAAMRWFTKPQEELALRDNIGCYNAGCS